MSASKAPKASWKREFFQFFGSLQLAIVLLLLIAAGSIIGTVLPQDQGPGVIHNATFHPLVKSALLALQAHDVYHAAWFLFLLAMLFINLAVCTYLRFPPTWRRYAMDVPPAPAVANLQEAVPLAGAVTEAKLDMLRKRGYRVSALPKGGHFAEKNKFVRLGPTFIHISLFAIIIGAIVGGLAGIKNSTPISVGETIRSEDVYQSAYIRGGLSQAPKPFDLKLDNFRLEFYPNGQVRQYYSDVTITPRDGGQPYQRTLWVNEPMVHEGVYFYQSFWGVSAVTFAVNGKTQKLPLTQMKLGYLSKPFEVAGKEYIFLLRSPMPLNEPAMLISTKDLQPKAQFLPGVALDIDGAQVYMDQYHLFSGLESKADPGIPIVYFGCGVLLFGLAMVPFSHRELWLREDDNGGLVLAGRTHKGRVMLRKEMEHIAAVWSTPGAAEASPAAIGVNAT